MGKYLEQIDLSDILKLEDIQKLQDAFSNLSEVPCLTSFKQGQFSKESNIPPFCKYVLSSLEGKKECMSCRDSLIKDCLVKSEIIIKQCMSGLTHIVIPIMLMKNTIGVMFVGGIISESNPPNITSKEISQKYGLNEIYLEKYKKELKIISQKRLDIIVDSLQKIAYTFSRMAFTNYFLITKAKQEMFIRELAALANEEFESKKILSTLCKNVANFFNVEQVTVFERNKDNHHIKLLEEYSLNSNTISIKEILDKKAYRTVISQWKKLNPDKKDFLLFENIDNAPFEDWTKDVYKKVGVQSLFMTTIENSESTYKAILLSSYSPRSWSEDEKILLEQVAKYVSVILRNANNFKEISHQKKQQEMILENIPFGAWVKDAKTKKYIYVNQLFCEYADTVAENIIGHSDKDLLPPALAEKYMNEDEEIVKQKLSQKYLGSIAGKNEDIEVKTYKIPLYDSQGRLTYILGIIEDITEDKSIERTKSEFISMVSHELRTPLTSIMGGLGILKSNIAKGNEKKILEIVDNNSHRLLNLVNEVLDLEKMIADQMVYDMEEFDINSIIDEACDEIEPFAKTFDATIEKDISEPCYTKVDKLKLIQAITNLLSNAIKYASDKKVNISTQILEKTVKIIVTNTGEPISEDFAKHIFEKFKQGNSPLTKKVGGSGLGLAICKLIVEKFNGEISFTSVNNRTSFVIELPIQIN